MKDKTLVIMAAGMGSRYGGLKQIEPVGPNQEFLIDYSIYDAIKAGFNKVIFIIKRENEEVFKETIGQRVDQHIKVEYAFQDINDVPENIIIPVERTKPLGTVHAILSIRNLIDAPFVVINADDFYGFDGYKILAEFLETLDKKQTGKYAMAGYRVINTLSPHGSVKRGLAIVEENQVKDLEECSIEKTGNKIIATPLNKNKPPIEVNKNEHVSMNMFAFTLDIINILTEKQKTFLEINNLLTCEYLISEAIQELIKENKIDLCSIDTTATWLGITYQEDKQKVEQKIKKLIENKVYPKQLW